MMKLTNVEKINDKEVKKIVNSDLSKSKKIQELFLGGYDVKSISELLEIRYNFAYNVISNYSRVNDLEEMIERTKKDSKKNEIIEMLNLGKTKIEISKELKMNYNYIWKIEKEMN